MLLLAPVPSMGCTMVGVHGIVTEELPQRVGLPDYWSEDDLLQ